MNGNAESVFFRDIKVITERKDVHVMISPRSITSITIDGFVGSTADLAYAPRLDLSVPFGESALISNINVSQLQISNAEAKSPVFTHAIELRNVSVVSPRLQECIFPSSFSLLVEQSSFTNVSTQWAANHLLIESNLLVESLINITTAPSFDERGVKFLFRGNTFRGTTFLVASQEISVARNNLFEQGFQSSGVELAPLLPWNIKSLGPPFVTSPPVDTRGNWWGDARGPSTCCNPSGTGTPVLWLTPYDPWCTDPSCRTLTSPMVNATIPLVFWKDMPRCLAEVYCPAEAPSSLYAIVAVLSLCVVATLAAIVLFIIRQHDSQLIKYRRILTVLCLASVVIGALAIASVVLIRPAEGRNAVAAYHKQDLLGDKFLPMLVNTLFITSKLVLLLILYRPSRPLPFAGIQHIFVYLAVECVTILIGLALESAILLSIQILNDEYPLRLLSVLVTGSLLPSNTTRGLQIADTIGLVVLNLSVLASIWKVLQIRDFGELDDISRDVEVRSMLLGAQSASIMRGERTLKPARRIAWFNVSRIVLLCVAASLLLISSIVPYPVSWYIAAIAASHAFFSVCTFALFFWFHYRPVFLMTAAALNLCQGLVFLAVLVYFDVLNFVYDFQSAYLKSQSLVYSANVFACATCAC
jgi:hypothetical protein